MRSLVGKAMDLVLDAAIARTDALITPEYIGLRRLDRITS
jgi:hypothetical protein